MYLTWEGYESAMKNQLNNATADNSPTTYNLLQKIAYATYLERGKRGSICSAVTHENDWEFAKKLLFDYVALHEIGHFGSLEESLSEHQQRHAYFSNIGVGDSDAFSGWLRAEQQIINAAMVLPNVLFNPAQLRLVA